MTRTTILLAAALCAGLPSLAHAQAPSPDHTPAAKLSLEFVAKPPDVQRAFDRISEQLAANHGEYAASLVRLEELFFTLNDGPNLEANVELRVLLARRTPLALSRNTVKLALAKLAKTHQQQTTLSARLTRAPRCACLKKHSHEHPAVRVDGALGGASGPTASVESAPPPARVKLVLVPFHVLDRTGTAEKSKQGTVYEVTWRGRIRIEGSVDERVALLRHLSGDVRAELSLEGAFEDALLGVVCSSLDLLDDAQRLERLGQAKPEGDPGQGLTAALGFAEALRMKIARKELSAGRLNRAETYLSRSEDAHAPAAKALRAALELKQRELDGILAACSKLRSDGEPGVALRVLESYYFAFDMGWSFSSRMELELAGTLLDLESPTRASWFLDAALRNDPRLETDPVYLELRSRIQR